MKLRRILVSSLSAVAIGQLLLLAWIDRGDSTLEMADASPGSIVFDGRLHARPRPSRLAVAFGGERLSNLIPERGCTVIMFFTSTCSALPSVGPLWRGVTTVETRRGRVPVHWVSLSPFDTLAATAAREHAGVSEVRWVSRSSDLYAYGVDVVPRAWVISSDLRLVGIGSTPSEVAEILSQCDGSTNVADARGEVR